MGVMAGTSKHALPKLRDVQYGTFHIPKLKLDKALNAGFTRRLRILPALLSLLVL